MLDDIFMERVWNLEKFVVENFKITQDTGKIKIIPEDTVCKACTELLLLSKYQSNGVLMFSIILNCEVYVAKCPNSDCPQYNKIVSYNGIPKGIINFNNKFFIGIELIKEYFDLYSKNGIKFTTWIKTKIDLYKFCSEAPLHKSIVKLPSYYGILHEAFCATTELFVFDKSDFFCCTEPEVIQIDATVNSIKMCRLPSFKQPWINESIVSRTTTRKQRQFDTLNSNDKKIINGIVLGQSCPKETLKQWQDHHHPALKTLSYCMIKKQDLYFLDKPAEMYAKTLLKSVAASSSIVPMKCVEIVKR